MDPISETTMQAAVLVSPLQAKYGEAVDPHSAEEMLAERAEETAKAQAEEEARVEAERQAAAEAKAAEKAAAAKAKQTEREAAAAEKQRLKDEERKERERNAAIKKTADRVGSVVTSGARTVVNQVLRNLFKK